MFILIFASSPFELSYIWHRRIKSVLAAISQYPVKTNGEELKNPHFKCLKKSSKALL